MIAARALQPLLYYCNCEVNAEEDHQRGENGLNQCESSRLVPQLGSRDP